MRRLVLVLLLCVTSGCDIQAAREAARRAQTSNHLKQLGLGLQNYHDTFDALPFGATSLRATFAQPSEPPTADRQIIYRASINLHVKSFADTDRKITALVSDAGGYISQFNEDRSYGTQRGGRWMLRLPTQKFSSFLDAVADLGFAERRDVQSQDVTEEYVDLESRLKNKQTLEARLLELVAKRGDEIKDVLALENELSRVREEIEKLQGRLRYLSDRVALTTIEISAYERLDYQPPTITFAQQIANTFTVSLDRLRRFAQAVVLVATALTPWVVAALLVMLPIGIIMLRHRRGRASIVTASAT